MLEGVRTRGLPVYHFYHVVGIAGLLVTIACLLVDALVILGKCLVGVGFLFPGDVSLLGIDYRGVDRGQLTTPYLGHPVSVGTDLRPSGPRGRLLSIENALLAYFGHLALEAVLETNHI